MVTRSQVAKRWVTIAGTGGRVGFVISAYRASPLTRTVQCLAITEGKRVRITVDDEGDPETLRLAVAVYDGLSDSEITEIEGIVLDRHSFFGQRIGGR